MCIRLALAFVLFGGTHGHAAADEYDATVIGYRCDKANDTLEVFYGPGGNFRIQPGIPNGKWNPWTLIASMEDEDTIGSLRTIHRRCHLSHGTYLLEMSPEPGNFNVQGRCGAYITAGVRILRNAREVVAYRSMEGDCHDMDGVVTTNIRIGPDRLPRYTEHAKQTYYRH